MQLVPLNNLGKYGVLADPNSQNLPPEAWSVVANVRMREGRVERMEGEASTFGTPTIGPHWLMPWEYAGTLYWLYANGTYVYRTDGTTHTNVTRYTTTPGDDDYNGGTSPDWNGCVLGAIPVINNGIDNPQQWNFVNERFEDLSNWPASTTAKVIRGFKNFLFALYTTEATVPYPTKLRWSTAAEPGAVPSSWDESDPTKLAGTINISDTAGDLVDCMSMGDVLVVYKTDSTWIMQLVGGQFIYKTTKTLQRHGMLAQGCAVEIDRKHIMLTRGDVIIHDGHQLDSIINQRNRRELFNTIDNEYAYKARVLPNFRQSEVWVCIPTGGSIGRLTTAFVFNYRENLWTRRDLDSITDGASGLSVGEDDYTFDGDTPGSFDEAIGAFGITGSYKASERLLLAKPDATAAILLTDSGYQFSGTNYNASVERTSVPLARVDREGNPVLDPGNVKFLRALHPRMSTTSGTATVQIQIGRQMTLDESVSWSAPFSFVVGTDTKIDCTISARYFSYRVYSQANHQWELMGMDFELEQIGSY
jgi:hypothetical protein